MNSKIANRIFRYDPDTGSLYWKISPASNVALGAEIKGENNNGYLRVGYKGKRYLAHRIIWLMVHGNLPDGQIDHIDHNRKNNRLANLRDVSASSNRRNQSIRANNKSGALGVSFYRKSQKWRARGWTLDGIEKHLGYFDNIEDAIEARKTFNRNNGYHINHGL